MLLLAPKVSVSQKVVIDTLRQTTLLDRNKTIEVGKIIQNEELLYQENQLLKAAVKALQNALRENDAQLELLTQEIAQAQNQLIELQQQMLTDSEKLLDLQRKKSKGGLYAYGEIGAALNTLDYNHFFVGGKYVYRKMIYSFSVNPINETPVYAAGIGFKIF